MIDQLDIIAAAVLIDNIVFQGVRKKGYFPGGAGLYAIAGASLFSENTLLVTCVGQDFSEKIGPWFESTKLIKSCMIPTHNKMTTPKILSTYCSKDRLS